MKKIVALGVLTFVYSLSYAPTPAAEAADVFRMGNATIATQRVSDIYYSFWTRLRDDALDRDKKPASPPPPSHDRPEPLPPQSHDRPAPPPPRYEMDRPPVPGPGPHRQAPPPGYRKPAPPPSHDRPAPPPPPRPEQNRPGSSTSGPRR